MAIKQLSGPLVLALFFATGLLSYSRQQVLSQTPGLDPAPPPAKLLWTVEDVGYYEEISADGLSLYTLKNKADSTYLAVWDLRTGKEMAGHKLSIKNYKSGPQFHKAWHAGSFFAFEWNGRLQVFDLNTGRQSSRDIPQPSSARGMSFSATGRYLARLDGNFCVQVIETATGKILHEVGDKDLPEKFTMLGKVGSFAFTSDEKYFLTSVRTETAPALRLWDTSTWKLVDSFHNQRSSGSPAPDGKTLLIPEGPPVQSSKDLERMYHDGDVGKIRIWDLAQRKDLANIPRKNLRSSHNCFDLRWSPDCKILAIWDHELTHDKSLQLFEYPTGRVLTSIDLIGKMREAYFTNDGTKFIYVQWGKDTLHVLDLGTGKQLWQMEVITNQPGPVGTITSDCKMIIVALKNALRYFDLADGKEKKVLRANFVSDLTVTTDRRFLFFNDCRRADGKPFGSDQQIDRSVEVKLISIDRVVELDTGREVFRTEHPDYRRFHFPGESKTMIQIAINWEKLSWDISCWEMPQR